MQILPGMQTAITKSFQNSTDLRLFPQDRCRIGTSCTVLETQDAWVQGKKMQIALVEFADGARRVWPVSALEMG